MMIGHWKDYLNARSNNRETLLPLRRIVDRRKTHSMIRGLGARPKFTVLNQRKPNEIANA